MTSPPTRAIRVAGAPALLLAALACAPDRPPAPPEEAVVVPGEGTVVVYVEADKSIAGPVLRTFSKQTGIEVRAVYRSEIPGDFLAAVKDEAVARRVDIVWALSPLSAIELTRSGFAQPFRPAGARPVLSQYRDPSYRWIGFAVNPRVILYNSDLVSRDEAPQSVEDLAEGRWAGRGAVARPAGGGPPAFHLASLFALWGENRARKFLETVRSNGTLIVPTDAAVVHAVAEGRALWGFVGLDLAICAKREADPVHIVFPDRLGWGAVVPPHVAVLVNGAPHPAQAKGLFGWLFSTEAAFVLGQNDCATVTILPDIPRPEWVPALGAFNIALLDSNRVFDAWRANGPFLDAWGAGPDAPAPAAPGPPTAAAAVREADAGLPAP